MTLKMFPSVACSSAGVFGTSRKIIGIHLVPVNYKKIFILKVFIDCISEVKSKLLSLSLPQ